MKKFDVLESLADVTFRQIPLLILSHPVGYKKRITYILETLEIIDLFHFITEF